MEDEDDELAAAAGIIDPRIRLIYLANESDINEINQISRNKDAEC